MNAKLRALAIATSLLLFSLPTLHAAPTDPKAVKVELEAILEKGSVPELAAFLSRCGHKGGGSLDPSDGAPNIYGDTLTDLILSTDFIKSQDRRNFLSMPESIGISHLGWTGSTLLEFAVERNKMDAAAWLLDNGASVNARDPMGGNSL